MRTHFILLICLLPFPVCPAEPTWLKGQLHLHSSESGDSKTHPVDVARWYSEHNFDFIVFTDHNHITTNVQAPPGMLVGAGVELTQNLNRCTPAVANQPCLLHINALFTNASRTIPWSQQTTIDRAEVYGRALDATRRLNGLAMLNHPNFHYSADAALLIKLARRGLSFVEIANEAVDSNNAGTEGRPSTVAMWDQALLGGAHLWGVATDDAHHYYDATRLSAAGKPVFVGNRGWVMVHAQRNLTDIRKALVAGEFYATTGLLFGSVVRGKNSISVTVAPTSATVSLRCITDGKPGPNISLKTLHCPLGAAKRFVRVEASDSDGRFAWTQPIWTTPKDARMN